MEAATDDVAFDQCMRLLDQSPYVLKHQVWQTKPLDPAVEKVVKPTLAGDLVLRWMSHKNKDDSTSFIVLERDSIHEFQEDDPDTLQLVMKRNGVALLADSIAASAMVFSKESISGFAGVIPCKQGEVNAEPYLWNGHDWD